MNRINALIIIAIIWLPVLAYSDTINIPANYPTIQDGIDAAVNGDTVLVAPGTYVENIDFHGKAITVQSSGGAEVTVIDGGSPPDPDFGSVVTFNKYEGLDSVLDGFTLTNGTGTKDPFLYYGGGVYCSSSSPTIINNTITDNSPHHDGGGVYCCYNSSPTLSNNLISGNMARDGGGVCCDKYSAPNINNNIISGNSAHDNGGGIYCGSNCSPTIKNNNISGNSAEDIGGGIFIGSSTPRINNNTLSENYAEIGGGIHCGNSDPTIKSNLIIKNMAGYYGGGISFVGEPSSHVTNNTVTENTADLGGGLYITSSKSSISITSSIYWNNSASLGSEIMLANSSSLTINYSNIKNYPSSIYLETGCTLHGEVGIINSDPLFVDPLNDNYHLQQDPCQPGIINPCVDKGDTNVICRGTTRTDYVRDDHTVDMGYHYPPENSIKINVPEDYSMIQLAIDNSWDGDTVIVAEGTYYENINFRGKEISVISKDGPGKTSIDGQCIETVVCFEAGESSDVVLKGFTIINGKGQGTGYEDSTGGGITCNNWASPTILENIIMHNSATMGGGLKCSYYSSPLVMNNIFKQNIVTDRGGGICCHKSSPLIEENIIISNQGEWGGFGIYCTESRCTTKIISNIISQNTSPSGAGIGGAGIIINNANPNTSVIIRGNIISDNIGTNSGGLRIARSTTIVENNIICENVATSTNAQGGGVHILESNVKMFGNIIYGNQSNFNGGGVFCRIDSSVYFTNNTVFDNHSNNKGGGLYIYDTVFDAHNNIYWNNQSSAGQEISLGESSKTSTLNISYSVVKGGKNKIHVESGCTLNWGPGMIDADPLFVDPANDDFHLTYPSPCKDTGDNSAVTEIYDFEGDPRIAYGTVDMGADEFYTHLYITGDKTPGGSIQGKFIGLPGTTPVGLFLGSGVLPSPIPTMWGEYWLQAPWFLFTLIPIPSNGILELPTTLPGSIPAPYDVPMQALIGLNPDSLTNLYVLEVR